MTVRPGMTATAQGPPKPYPPPNLHGHKVVGLSGDTFQAVWRELAEQGEGLQQEPRPGARPYLMIGPTTAVYPRTDPTRPPAHRARWARWAAIAAAGVVLMPWLLAIGTYAWAFYSLYAQSVIRLFY